MQMPVDGGDRGDMNDASRHMKHYLDSTGTPVAGLDHQVNVWDRYNWDVGEDVPMGRFRHKAGSAQEFDMAGSSSVKHCEPGSGAAVPTPDGPGRHGRDGGGDVDR
ncbi:hypothetical protein AB0N09_22335 [Streptomyces erythrochromogenes]|uniref:hypothetical protein n=1 Tax=Streptomyces erythrochromogenes TaxID=285574 RepID=UPI003418A11E